MELAQASLVDWIRSQYDGAADVVPFMIGDGPPGNINGGDTFQSGTVTGPADSDWYWIGSAMRVTNAMSSGDRIFMGKFRARIGQSARFLGDGPRSSTAGDLGGTGWVPMVSFFGQTTDPHYFAAPIKFSRGDYFTWEVFNGNAGALGQLFLTFLGVKVLR